jgi:Lectin C-type domain
MKWRALFGASWTLTLGCSALLNLDELEKADCVGADCGGMLQASGNGGSGVNVAGAHAQAGSSQTTVAGRGGNTSSAGKDSGSIDGGDSADNGGSSATGGSVAGDSGGSSVIGGTGGSSGGTGGSGGTQTGGAGGQSGAGTCQPSATDKSCDGLDQACHSTAADAGCSGACKGTFVQGSSYMSCLAGSSFDQAEATCRANGMHLAKIGSAPENATVLSLAQDDYVWVGGSNLADANVFTWADGTPFYSFSTAVAGYKNFEPGEPVQNPALRCVQLMQLTNGTWSNWDCAEAQSFVCERY